MFKWLFGKRSTDYTYTGEPVAIKSEALLEHERRIEDAKDVRDGEYVGYKYRVYRTAANTFIVQRYNGIHFQTMRGEGRDGWETALYDYSDVRFSFSLTPKHFYSVEEAEEAAKKYATKLKRQWEQRQLVGPVKDLGRLP